MSEFEQVLQQCLLDVDAGAATVEECLARHPQHADQLEPVLQASAYLARGREARVSDAFRARVRSRLVQDLYAHPRRPARAGFSFLRLAAGLALALFVFLAAGTAYAQSALPGQVFYGWKVASEEVWRALSPDPVDVDLALTQRRAEELIATQQDPALHALALEAYLEMLARLQQEVNPANEGRIREALDSQREALSQAGVLLPAVTPPPGLPPVELPTATPTTDPLPVRQTPQASPTGLPPVAPTLQPPTENIPPIEPPTDIVPTLPLPSLP